ncbi:hypothetical protein DFR70_111178 [Nocardia tenerifensis]|uniref:Polyketide cyclase/dehydrase/lipid transport protein n=1 Tax=Nocardia tenerifensis TaxID=228006 RepID=A0A318JV34_9NOCA|nr:hypothetical protein [Nocardia tenerifensis]PXX59794.1 hypothetical protein DFR70_111178 [Nocardia tenerifensis]
MSYLDKAKEQLTDLAQKVTGNSDGNSQTVTIARPRAQVEQFWRDPDALSKVFGDLADVRSTSPTSFTWTPHNAADDSPSWQTRLVAEDGSLRFVDVSSVGKGMELRLTFADAPRDLGTEVTMRVQTPIPDLLTGAATFQALYRARALLQTGEVPSLAHNPSAR